MFLNMIFLALISPAFLNYSKTQLISLNMYSSLLLIVIKSIFVVMILILLLFLIRIWIILNKTYSAHLHDFLHLSSSCWACSMLAAASGEHQSFRKPKVLQHEFHESWKASKSIFNHCLRSLSCWMAGECSWARGTGRDHEGNAKTLGLAAWPCDALWCVVHLFHPKSELSDLHQKLHSPRNESFSFRVLQWLSSFSVICQLCFMENAWKCRTWTNLHLESAYRIEHKSEFQPGSQEASRKVSQRLDIWKENLQMVQNGTLKPIPWCSDIFLNKISCVFLVYFGAEGIVQKGELHVNLKVNRLHVALRSATSIEIDRLSFILRYEQWRTREGPRECGQRKLI